MALKHDLITLNNGVKMPNFGLGTWLSDTGLVQKAVEVAIDAGYRHIDCAYCYANENEVGAGIKTKIDAGVVKREDLFLTSKLWNTFHRPENVEFALNETLVELGVDYLDLFLIHWPVPMQFEGKSRGFGHADGLKIDDDAHYLDTWKAMEALYRSGKVKAIGVSNFNVYQLNKVLANCEIKPMMNQIELHGYNTQAELVSLCHKNDIHVTAYSPLGNPGRPAGLNTGQPALMENSVIGDIAKKHNKPVANVCIKFALARGLVCIPKSTTPGRILANSEVFDFELEQAEVDAMLALDSGTRYVAAPAFKKSKFYPFVSDYKD